MAGNRPTEHVPKKPAGPPAKTIAPEVKDALRALAMHTAAIEAKMWATVHFLVASGTVNLEDYRQFMLKSHVQVAEAQKKFFNRIGKTLKKRGVI